MQNIAAPDSASVLMWVKCQSVASPFSAEYWHIGATMMRLASFRPRSSIGENRLLMWGNPKGGRRGDRTQDEVPPLILPEGKPLGSPCATGVAGLSAGRVYFSHQRTA